MPDPQSHRADPRTGREDIRPLSRTTTRVLVAVFLIVAIAVAFWMATVVIDGARNPASQERLEEMQRQEQATPAE